MSTNQSAILGVNKQNEGLHENVLLSVAREALC